MRILLITGLGRSGSTITQKVINAHPEVFISDESWHFLGAANTYAGRNSRMLMGMTDRQYAQCIGRYLSSLYSKISGPVTIYGDKCPPAYTKLDDIKTILNTGNQSLEIVWTIRHPYDLAISWIERFREKSMWELGFYGLQPDSKQYKLNDVVESVFKVWKNQQLTMQMHRGHIVIYERLTENPVEEMLKLHKWLGLEFSDSQLASAFDTAVIGGDPKFENTRKIHTESRYRYRKAPGETRKILENAAERINIKVHFDRYGYEG